MTPEGRASEGGTRVKPAWERPQPNLCQDENCECVGHCGRRQSEFLARDHHRDKDQDSGFL